MHLLPWPKKKNDLRDSRREERCSMCDIMLDHARSAQGKSRGQSRIGPCPALIACDRAWYHTWNSFLLAVNLEDGSFFLARVVLCMFVCLRVFFFFFFFESHLSHVSLKVSWCQKFCSSSTHWKDLLVCSSGWAVCFLCLVTQAYNDSLTFDGSDPVMAYYIRDPVQTGKRLVWSA